MKKKILVILALAMIIFVFAGCGKGSSQQAVSSKDYVYKMTPLELKMGQNETLSMMIKAGEVMYAYDYEYKDGGTVILHYASLNGDGTVKTENSISLGADGSFTNIVCDEDGFIYAVKDIYAQEPDEEGNYIDKFYFVKLAENGDEIFSIFLNDMPEVKASVEDGWLYASDLLIYNENIYIKIIDNYFIFDKEGNFKKILSIQDGETTDNVSLYPLADGKMAGYVSGEDGAYVGYVDMETGKISDKSKIPGASYDFSVYAGNTKHELYLVNSYGVYGYNIGDTDMTQVMSYVDSDLDIFGLYNLLSINDREFFATYNDPANYDTQIGKFTKVDPEDVKDKKTIVLACAGLDWDIRGRVVEFNKNNEEYRISIQDYSSLYGSDTDFQAGINRLNADIVSGKVPDILVLNYDMPVASYIAKGLFEDLKPYIEEDEELDINNYMPNIVDAYSVNGKMYRMVPSFMINTLLAKTSDVGKERGWTIQDVNKLMSTKPEETVFLNNVDRNTMLINCMNMAGNQFIDWKMGKCSFDTDGFIEMLEFVKQFPEVLDDTAFSDEYWENYDSMWREGKVVTMMYTVSNFRDYNYMAKGSFGEPVTMIGFPSSNEDGSSIMPAMQIAMSAKSDEKEGVWQFLRYYLTDEYQDSITYGFPISIKKLNAMAEEAMKKPTYTDENGKEVETQDYYYLSGVEIPIEPMTKEEVENFKEMLYTFNQVYNYDEELIQIIEEEAAAFFNGQKNAKDVASIIQSRAQIYVNENR